MEITSKSEAVELLITALPYSNQIKNIDLEKKDCIYFDWRSCRYKIELNPFDCMASTTGGNILEGNDCSILIGHILKKQIVINKLA